MGGSYEELEEGMRIDRRSYLAPPPRLRRVCSLVVSAAMLMAFVGFALHYSMHGCEAWVAGGACESPFLRMRMTRVCKDACRPAATAPRHSPLPRHPAAQRDTRGVATSGAGMRRDLRSPGALDLVGRRVCVRGLERTEANRFDLNGRCGTVLIHRVALDDWLDERFFVLDLEGGLGRIALEEANLVPAGK